MDETFTFDADECIDGKTEGEGENDREMEAEKVNECGVLIGGCVEGSPESARVRASSDIYLQVSCHSVFSRCELLIDLRLWSDP